jgi:exodeoxyribonuclease VII small subunit
MQVLAVSAKPKKAGFEQSLAELEELVAQMESGSLPLDEALRHFERGVQLTRECQLALQAAQARVQILAQGPAGRNVEDFNVDSGGAAGGETS